MPRPPKQGPTLVTEPPIVEIPEPYTSLTDFRADGLALLEVTEEQLSEVARIEHLFKGIGGQNRVFECLAGSEEKEARLLVALKKRLTNQQAAHVPFEAFCVAAKVTTKRMFGIISQEIMEQSEKATALLAKAMHPEIVQKTIDFAMSPFGEKDRRMLHQNAGFVPVPRTAVTHFHGHVDARTQTQNVALLPSVDDTMRRLSDRFNTMSIATPAPALAIEAVEDDDDSED